MTYNKTPYRPSSLSSRFLIILCSGWLSLSLLAHADIVNERRVQIALQVFPRIVAVDRHFQEKLTAHKKVLFVFLYQSDKDKALRLSTALADKLSNVAGMEYNSKTESLNSQLTDSATLPTAMFVAESLDDKAFKRVLEYAIKNQRILFSPFTGDVERGATAGIAITSRVNPYFNVKTLQSSNIKINTLLMNLSKRYE